MSTQNAQPKYFNLHTSGIGYLSDIREIKPKKEMHFGLVELLLLQVLPILRNIVF